MSGVSQWNSSASHYEIILKTEKSLIGKTTTSSYLFKWAICKPLYFFNTDLVLTWFLPVITTMECLLLRYGPTIGLLTTWMHLWRWPLLEVEIIRWHLFSSCFLTPLERILRQRTSVRRTSVITSSDVWIKQKQATQYTSRQVLLVRCKRKYFFKKKNVEAITNLHSIPGHRSKRSKYGGICWSDRRR